MTDFTLAELLIIRALINSTDEKMLTASEQIMMVQSKIQWMIDNDCDHEWHDAMHQRCSKCFETQEY